MRICRDLQGFTRLWERICKDSQLWKRICEDLWETLGEDS